MQSGLGQSGAGLDLAGGVGVVYGESVGKAGSGVEVGWGTGEQAGMNIQIKKEKA
jgi:hypothetical protein